jgi:hypothetical protein
MRQTLLFLFFLLAIHTLPAQFPVAPDVVYDFIKSNSIHRNKVDWGEVDNQFFRSLSAARTLRDTMDAFTGVLKALDDVHSQIYLNNQYYGYWHVNEGPDATRLSKLVELATGSLRKGRIRFAGRSIRLPACSCYECLWP